MRRRKLIAVGVALACAPAPVSSALAKPGRQPRLGAWVHVTLTRASLSQALQPERRVRFSSDRLQLHRLEVNPSVSYQRMIGFGGAMTDSSAWLLERQLSPAARARVIKALFSRAGIHLDFTRVPIGASDFTANGTPYTYDDLPAGKTDPQLQDFSIAHDQAYIIPALRQMLATNPLVQVMASEWSPPAWMKANDSLDNIDFKGTLLPADYQSLALYFTKFIRAYRQQGIPIWGLTPQNEPYSPSPYPGMTFTPADEAWFVRQDLVPALAAAHLHPAIFGDDDTQLALAEKLMRSPAARHLAGMAWHCYQGQQTMTVFHRLYPAVPDLVSECSPGIIPYGAAEAAIDGTRNWGSAVNLWNLALDPSGGPVESPNQGCGHCTGLVTISKSSHTVSYSASYYELGQFSKFVQPGAVRIQTPRWVSDYKIPGKHGSASFGVTRGLDNVAFKNPDGTYVLICHQNSDAPVSFGVEFRGEAFKYRLPGLGTATFTWR